MAAHLGGGVRVKQPQRYEWVAAIARRCQHYGLPLVLGMMATIAVLGLWQELTVREQLHVQNLVQQEAAAIESHLNRELSAQILALERMASRWQASGGTPQRLWEMDATNYIKDFPAHQAIAWVDPSLRIRWIVPWQANQTVQNFDFSQTPQVRSTFSVARDLRQTLLTRTLALPEGGKGFLAAVPLFITTPNQQPDKQTASDRFDGWIVGVFEFHTLFDTILTASPKYQVQIHDRTGLIYSQVKAPPTTAPKQVVVQAYSTDWQVQVFPTAELITKGRSRLPMVVLSGGLAGSWTLALTVYLGQRATHQAKRAQKMNQQLQAEIRHRQQAEAALEKQLLHSNLLFNTSRDGIVIINQAGNVVQTSASFAEMLGYSVEATLGLNVADWEVQWTKEELDQIRAREQVMPLFETQHRRQDGSVYDVEISWSRDTIKGERLDFCVCRDISDRKRVEAERKTAAAAIAESQRRYRNLIENSPDLIERFDLQLRHLYGSPSLTEITGIAPEVFLGKTCRELGLDQAMVNTWETAVATLLRTGEKQVIEFSILTTQGNRSFEMAIAPELSEHQIIESILCISRDITERQQAEQALRHSEATKQAIIQAIPDLLIRMHADGRYVEFIANKQFNIINPDHYRQHVTVHDILPPDLAQLRLHYSQQALASGITQIYEQEILIQGKRCYEEVRIVPLLSDQVLVMVRDITEQQAALRQRQQAEEDLRHQKEMFQAIVDHIPIMIALFDQQGQFQFINPTLEHILGWSLEDWQNRDILADCYPDPEYRQSALDHMLATTGDWKDMITLNRTGQQLETSWANVRLSGGGYLGIGQDISDRKHKEVALQQAMEAAEAANRAKSIFLANMSHELRTPLNVILGFTQVMAHDTSLTASQQEDLQTIRRSGDHLLSLISDVLDLSKIEAGYCALEPSRFDLIALLHTLRTMMTERAHAKQLQLEFDIAPEVPQFVLADEQKLRQILLNLLSNAIKFTHHGSVKLQVTAPFPSLSQNSKLKTQNSKLPLPPSPPLPLPPSPPPSPLQFTVTDTGIGIAPNEQETIFDAFVQAEAGKKSLSGTGLGLTISRKLVELMQGEISVHSVPSVGSQFTFCVPVCPINGIQIPPEQGDRRVIGLAPGQPDYRILVVDDQRGNRLVLVRLLTHLGLEVREATNGHEAIHLWQEWQPDLIWMDVRMPGLDGYEATKQIRAMEPEPTSIIIALTAQASRSDRDLALAAGCNDYLSKPFRQETLLLKLKEHLGLEYLYAPSPSLPLALPMPENDANQTRSIPLDPALRAQLPMHWLAELEEATVCGNDRAIAALVAQLPPELAAFGTELTHLAEQFQFEQIMHLIHPAAPP